MILDNYIFRVIDEIFHGVEQHIEKDSLITQLNMSALPSLYKHLVNLIEYLVSIRKIMHYICEMVLL